MKHFLIFLFISTFLISSCSSKMTREEIQGEWKFTDFSANLPTLNQAIIEGAKLEALSSLYTFNSDNTYVLTSDFHSNGIKGDYTLNYETQNIQFSYLDNGSKAEETFSIKKLSSKSMYWTDDMGELGSLTMTLTKQ